MLVVARSKNMEYCSAWSKSSQVLKEDQSITDEQYILYCIEIQYQKLGLYWYWLISQNSAIPIPNQYQQQITIQRLFRVTKCIFQKISSSKTTQTTTYITLTFQSSRKPNFVSDLLSIFTAQLHQLTLQAT